MKPERYARVKELLLTARGMSAADRRGYLERECGDDPTLIEEVESLLEHEIDTPSILATAGISGRIDAGMARDLSADAKMPERIGPYRILGILGEGGMGVVYRARQTEPIRREVALKLIRRGMDTDRVVTRFESERQALAMMDHPGIARVLDAGADDRGRPFFVMELVRGIPLIDYADQERLSIRARLELFLAVLNAVQHAHQRGIIHRDLKPTNVLVTEQDGRPQPKVIDFGIAKATEAAASGQSLLTQEGQLVGTPEYMSPEQAGYGDAGVDTRTDVYSLGVLLYELLTGRRPYRFEKFSIREIQRVIGEEDAEPPSSAISRLSEEEATGVTATRGSSRDSLRRRLAGDLDNIILMSLRKEPDRRYPSVEQLGEDVRRHLEGRTVRARKDTWSYRTGKFIRRHRMGVGTAAAGVLVLLAFAATMAVQSARVARERDRAVAAEARARSEANTSSRISEFLVELFEVADPYVSQGDEVTAREILDEGADRIGSELADEPEVQAALMATMSKAYVGLRIQDRAVPLAERSLATRIDLFGEHHLAVAESHLAVGAGYSVKGDFDTAEEHYRRALAIRRDLIGPPDEALAEAADMLALCLQTKAQFAEAESLYREALAMKRELLEEDDPGLIWAINNLGGILHAQGEMEEGLPLLEEALARARAAAEDSILIADIMSELAVIYKTDEHYEKAEPMYLGALSIRQRVFGPEHPMTAQSHNNYGVFLRTTGKSELALPHLRKALEVHRSLRGDDHLDVAIARTNLARTLAEVGSRSEAETQYLAAIRSVENSMGRDYWVYGQIRYNYGAFLFDGRRYREAEINLLAGYEGLAGGLGPRHRRTLIALEKLVALYETTRRTEEADAYRARLEDGS